MADTPRTLLLLHPVQAPISEEEARLALPQAQQDGTIEVVRLEVPWGDSLPWGDLQRAQTAAYQQHIAPILAQHPDTIVAYFGAAPIPLAVHLGFLLSTWTKVQIYQHHHERKIWSWLSTNRGAVAVATRNMPTDDNESTGDIVLRISVSLPVLALDTRAVTARTVAEVEIAADPLGFDVLESPADLEHVAGEVVRALLRVLARRPRADRVHLFYAGPVGLAFRIGTLLNPTVVPGVFLYQYRRTKDPRYKKALTLLAETQEETLTSSERESADQVRARWRSSLQELTLWARERPPRKGAHWLSALDLPDISDKLLPFGWKTLGILGTGRFKDSVLGEQRNVEDGFWFDRENNRWEIADSLLLAVAQRLMPEEWDMAARLFFLHEALHLDSQGVTAETAWRIGQRHPLLAEDFDYRADVWALLHELRFSWERGEAGQRPKDQPIHWMRRAIDINTQVIWAFVSPQEAHRQLELRRFRRFLMWYWLSIELSETSNLKSAACLLFDKPILSVSGPVIHSTGGRTYLLLDQPMEFEPEAALVYGNRLKRVGSGDSMDLRAAVEGLKGRDPAPLRRALRGLHDLVAKSE